ncbi:MAG: TetR/AcrR family transcriptional regulator [Proteobacteria bacterium]|nr:TetR/AcrR family transcriptional regulator [Desulfobacteraceae bacterium]MBU4316614.1 TetR/AcrR family transcriptional regulator [Pseudomonadota bacterium]MBU4472391.1 TetR/AcrR family transcriptional regulator [Pseudomonadota bacterium]MCG2752087.1 TetR/AcrR family transcriptional regulator [Desulfobacteraceae bacterium]
MKNQQEPVENTKDRILQKAEKLFSDNGFNGVSIRDITRAADCNVAAVNYHFGNKENLYFDVFRRSILPKMAANRSRIEAYLAQSQEISLETVIRALVTTLFTHNIMEKKDDTFNRLILSERQSPVGVKDIIINEALVPFFESLMDVFKPHFPKGMDESQIKLNLLGILAMTLYFAHSRLSVSRFVNREYDEAFIHQIIEHTVFFALNGLKQA